MSTENLGGQFRGWINPKISSISNRPERTGEDLPKASDVNHKQLITKELANHPKKIGYNLFIRGLNSLGVKDTPQNLERISGLISSDNAKFHELVRTARKNAFGEKQTVANFKKKKNK